MAKLHIFPKGILIAVLVAVTVYAWRPDFFGGVPLYKVIFPIYFIWMLFTKQITDKTIGFNLKRSSSCWLVLLSWGILSLLWIDYTGNEWTIISYDLNWILIGIVFSVLCIRERNKERILTFFCIFAGIISFMGLFTAFTGYYFNQTYESYYYNRNFFNLYRPNSIFYNVNDHAVFMFFSIIVLFLATEKKNMGALWRLIGMVLFCSNIVLVDSRGVELGLMLFFVLYLFNTRKLNWYYKIVIIIAVVLFTFFNFDLILNLGIFSDGINDSGRISILTMCMSSFKRSNFLGVGPGNIALVNDYFFSATTVAPHNFFIEILCDYGVVGFISIAVWFIGNLSCALRMSKYDSRALIVWVALISFLPVSIVSSSLFGKSWVACFFGIIVSTLNSIECTVSNYIGLSKK